MNKRFSTARLSLTAIGGVLLMGLLFAACKKSDDLPATPVAGLMAFNLATDKASIGFALSGNALTSAPLSYTNFNGGYQTIYTGNRTAEAYDFNSGAAFTSSSFNFEAGKYYSIFLVGANNTYSNVITWDNLDSLSSSSGSAYIRYINAIPDSSKPLVTIASNGTNVVNTNAGFSAISEFTAVTPGSVTITVNNSGTINTNRTINLEQRKIYTVLLSGIPGSTDDAKAVQIKYIENGTLPESGTGN